MEILGYIIAFSVGVPLFLALVVMALLPIIQRSKSEDVFVDWYATRELLLRCMPWVEPQDQWAWLAGYSSIIDWVGPSRFCYTAGIGITNRRQCWLPSGEEVAL